MVPAQINYWAVLVSALIGLILGTVWYSPKAFGKLRATAAGQTAGRLQPLTLLKAFLVFLVMSYILAHFVDYVSATTFLEGAVTGIWLWIGFVGSTLLINSWSERQPLRLWLINAGYYLVVLAVTGALLAAWA